MDKNNKNKIRVVVAMSGGVDSSVAAALLKKQGYDVVGVFMRFWSEKTLIGRGFENTPPIERRSENTCCSEGAEQAARDVATKLGIPFYILNAQKEFKKAVVDYFLAEEKKGRTPNPCVVCNKKIKFGLLFDKAMALGADYIATGHYARLRREIRNPKSEIQNKFKIQNSKLFKAKDKNKDQSYFLYTLTQEKLGRFLFPVGNLKKDEVYALAKKWKLPYRKEESFDLCFVANDRESFLKKYLKVKSGEIKGVNEKALGAHHGLALYTIGQRKNIPVGQGPWWVVKKDEKKNILYVTNNEKDLYSCELVATDVNWLNSTAPKLPVKVLAKIRYKSEAGEAILVKSSKLKVQSLGVIFKKPQRAITPGQSVVFYGEDGELLGGGVIS